MFRVGDADAKKLADGFAFFKAKDLQNLEAGQAICRVERANGDFNLSIPLPAMPSEAEARDRHNQVITASREKYAVSRREIEEKARAHFASEHPKNEAKPATKAAEQPAPKPEKSDSPVSKPLAETSPAVCAAPETREPAPLIAKPEIASESPPAEAYSKQPLDKGIGGNQHNLIRERIELVARELGYTTSREKSTGDGGKIDVVLEKADRAIACEIAITTTIDHEVGNVAKCLKAGFKLVAVISPGIDRLQKIEAAVRACVSAEEALRVAFYQPDIFIAFLHGLRAGDAAPAPAGPSESTFGKYKVKRSAATLTSDEKKEREAAALRIMAETMRRKE